jgi:hypothetical protein
MASDVFTGLAAGANLSTRSPWVQKTGAITGEAAGGQVRPNSAAPVDSIYRYESGTWDADQSAECAVAWTGSTTSCIGPAIRLSATGSGYGLIVSETGTIFLNLYTNGVFTGALFSTSGVASGSVIKLQAIGTTIKAFDDGVEIFSGTDATHATGSPGLAAYLNSATIFADNWSASGDSAVVKQPPWAGLYGRGGYRNIPRMFGKWPGSKTSGFIGQDAIFFDAIAGGGTTFTITPTGGLVFSGTNVVSRGRRFNPSSGLVFSGTTLTQRGRLFNPSGSIVFSGTTTNVRSRQISPAGTVLFSGTAPITFTSGGGSFVITPSGGITFSGSNVLIKSKVYLPTGGLIFSGTASFSRGRIISSSGGLVFSGTTAFIKSNFYEPSGGVVFSGSAPMIFTPGGVLGGTSTKLPLTGAGTT